VRLTLPSFSRSWMGEKFFRILSGGLMATVCPEDGRWARIFPSGWKHGEPKTALVFTFKKSDKPSPCIPFSHAVCRDRCILRRGAVTSHAYYRQREKDGIRR